MKKIAAILLFAMPFVVLSQEDTSSFDADEFDFSQFELAAPAAKSYCNNKVLGQSPTSLIGLVYNFQAPHSLTAGNVVAANSSNIENEVEVTGAHRFSLVGNFPLLSRNNILINLNTVYQEQHYNISGSNGHPLVRSLQTNPLRRAATLFTIFKPLNDKTFLLGQVGFELNGDYSFDNFQSLNTIRVPVAALYGWKPNDRLMYGFGLSRTYLGGALNYVPVAYYYHTFKNEKWGIEALLPARGMLRYRFNSLSLISLGFNISGATYRLNNFSEFSNDLAQSNSVIVPPELREAREVELRRSEIRAGLNYSRQIRGFFWLSAEAGYRINYSYNLDQGGEKLRLLGNDEPYFIENQLENPLYFTVGISYVSP